VADDETPVLIAGGSLVGLSTAVFLGAHGVPSLVVERHRGTAIHPRAALFLQRTIELYRSVGLEDEIVDASQREFVQNGAIVAVESLAGRELQWFFRFINEGVEDLSPSPRLFLTQVGIEPILHRHAEELGACVQWGTELVSFEADGDGVTAVLRERDSGDERHVRVQYLVGADGARSPVRQALGIPMCGHPTFSDSITIYFRADVRPLIGDRNLSVVYVANPRVQGFFRFSLEGDAGFLVVNSALDADGERTTDVADDMGDERCVAYVRDALGDPDIAVEVESVQRWAASAEWAERFADGRVFLAGDSAHVMPPTGGFGGNTGVQDGHNLAWKLAYVLNGTAGSGLLSTYDDERRPISAFTVEQAYTRYVTRIDPGLGTDGLEPFVDEALVDLGYGYGVEPLCEDPQEPSAAPGRRAPHAVVDGRSTLDLFGRRFVLLGDEAWCDAARSAAGALGVPLDAHAVTPERYGIGEAGASLVRPDGFVAWRTDEPAADAEAVVSNELARILAR
jgi:2-polyprenyl-6-methoxyphenol hydroxylase-like FAD-dependent oxidoreductase